MIIALNVLQRMEAGDGVDDWDEMVVKIALFDQIRVNGQSARHREVGIPTAESDHTGAKHERDEATDSVYTIKTS